MKTTLLTTLIAATLALSTLPALAAVPKDMLVIGKLPIRKRWIRRSLSITTTGR